MSHSIIIVGAFHEIIELAEENNFEIIGFIDNEKAGLYRGYKILCNDLEANNLDNSFKKYDLVITPDKPEIRRKLFNYYKNLGFKFSSIISSHSKISKSSEIGEGTIVQYGVNISAECQIGKFTKINTYANIMHNTSVGDFTTIAPNSLILGRVSIGNACYIGANATILPGLSVGNNAIIGAGAIVTKNVERGKVMLGNPARELNK